MGRFLTATWPPEEWAARAAAATTKAPRPPAFGAFLFQEFARLLYARQR